MVKQTPPFNPDVRPVDFKKVTSWLPDSMQQAIIVEMLGRRSKFQCYSDKSTNEIIIPYVDKNNHQQEYHIKQIEWERVCEVIEWAIKRGVNPELTYWYNNHPDHPEAPRVPNLYFGPNVPAICRAYNESARDYVILRPVKAGKDRLRLGLFTADYRKYVNEIKMTKRLLVDFGTGIHDIMAVKTYIRHGSITDSNIVSTWLHSKGYTNSTNLLVFKLNIDRTNQTHTYRFVKKIA